MSKMRHCEACKKPIVWDEELVQIEENGDLYHEGCCSILPIRYGVMVGDDYKGSLYKEPSTACVLLDYGEYIDIEVDEEDEG